MKLALPGAMVALALLSAGGMADAQVNPDAVEGPAVNPPGELESAPPDAELDAPVDRAPRGEIEAQGRSGAEAEAQAEPRGARGEAEGRIQGEARGNAESRQTENEFDFGASIDADADGGLRVGTVNEEGLAADAGLREGDVITSVDGREFTSQNELDAFLRDRGDARIPITVMRDGREEEMFLNARARTESRAGADADIGNRVALGVSLRSGSDGIAVVRVRPGSPAARAGLRTGDRIVSLNGEDFTSVDPFVDSVGRVRLNSDADLVYLRNGQRFQTTFRPLPWNDVYADAGGGFETRQSLRPDLAPPPPNGAIQNGYAPATTYSGGAGFYSGQTYPCPNGRIYNRGFYYDSDDWEDRYDD